MTLPIPKLRAAEDDVVICCAVRTPLCKAKRGAFKDFDGFGGVAGVSFLAKIVELVALLLLFQGKWLFRRDGILKSKPMVVSPKLCQYPRVRNSIYFLQLNLT